MTLRTCGREKELTELLDQGYWPEVASDDLRAHVNGCLPCQSLILVKQAFSAERAHAAAAARLEPPGVLWWRAQLRRRKAAIETIARPILGAQIFALAIALAAAAIYLASQGGKEFAWLATASPRASPRSAAARFPRQVPGRNVAGSFAGRPAGVDERSGGLFRIRQAIARLSRAALVPSQAPALEGFSGIPSVPLAIQSGKERY